MERSGPALSIASEIDRQLTTVGLVVGLRPTDDPHLDLLVDRAGLDAVALRCAEEGLVRRGRTWAAFPAAGRCYAVSVECTANWPARPAATALLFADAEAIPGFQHLRRPAPPVRLILSARSTVRRRGRLCADTRAMVTQALTADPAAWDRAGELAARLGLTGSLLLLRRVYDDPPTSTPARAAVALKYVFGADTAASRAESVRQALPSRWLPSVVSLSGLDGAGKSTQASRLSSSLNQLGVRAGTCWAGFSVSPKLYRLVDTLGRRPRREAEHPDVTDSGRDPFLPSGCRSPSTRAVWVATIAVFNAALLWSHRIRFMMRTEVLIFDRYAPDTVVKLRYFYAMQRHLEVARAERLFTALSPAPTVGFYVALPGEMAYERRPEHWSVSELSQMACLYDQQAPRFRLIELDGRRSPDDLHAEIAQRVWGTDGR